MADKKIGLIEIAGDDQSSQKNARGYLLFLEKPTQWFVVGFQLSDSYMSADPFCLIERKSP